MKTNLKIEAPIEAQFTEWIKPLKTFLMKKTNSFKLQKLGKLVQNAKRRVVNKFEMKNNLDIIIDESLTMIHLNFDVCHWNGLGSFKEFLFQTVLDDFKMF